MSSAARQNSEMFPVKVGYFSTHFAERERLFFSSRQIESPVRLIKTKEEDRLSNVHIWVGNVFFVSFFSDVSLRSPEMVFSVMLSLLCSGVTYDI